ncbi:beta-lactamase/transpeptidase-like protein [Aulographum hederae CBS 113979]|uniref:Beta-lactamase/transpeptidase-like protein n=1 Tax=Aulographum hederae CBS 113979 TaxID=1176131 RepID=A0A6G1GJM5_9PEZI|nr:beta-lactamase/transpeptidase-like protein [Aulographum hederae CBS 113979]
MRRNWLLGCLFLVDLVSCRCNDPSPAFPLPSYKGSSAFFEVFASIEDALHDEVSQDRYYNSSFSIEVTSSQETLWSFFHTALNRNESRPGAKVVQGDSVFRIASVSKTFTILAILQQHAAGNLSLDSSILDYVPELNEDQKGTLPWKDITIRSLGSQLSGLPRDFAQADFQNGPGDPTRFGLPPLDTGNESVQYEFPFKRKDLLENVKSRSPLFAPNQKSSYSNIAFELLGLVLENVTGLSFDEYLDCSIFRPLELNSTSLLKPDDDVAVIPLGPQYWDVDAGIQNPTGGIYSSSSDLSRYLRHILTHYNGLTPTTNWINPASFAEGVNSFIGMPWEMFRTTRILSTTSRPTTFVTKSGGVPGYFSIIILAPEYDLGISILVAGSPLLLGRALEIVATPLVRAAESLAFDGLRERYAGTYTPFSSKLNSTLTLAVSPGVGLYVSQFISNGTDVLSALFNIIEPGGGQVRLLPTLLFADETAQDGEQWRALKITQPSDEERSNVWDDFCIPNWDIASYAGRPLNEIIFWGGDEDKAIEVELPAFRIKLAKIKSGGNHDTFTIQT